MGRTKTQYTVKERKKHLVSYRQSGLTGKEYAEQEGLHPTTLYGWDRRYSARLGKKGNGASRRVERLRDNTNPGSRRHIIDAIIDLLKYLE